MRALGTILLSSVLLLGLRIQAASTPDWLRPLLKEDISAWNDSYSVIRLLNFDKVDYLSEDRTRELTRGAVRLTTAMGTEQSFARMTYNADTDHVRTARAWVISADGKKVQSFSRGDFQDAIAVYSTHFWNAARTISFLSDDKLEIGGVLAWEFELDCESAIFDSNHGFLSSSPLLSGVFEVSPPVGGKLEWFSTSSSLSKPVAGTNPGALRWEVRRLDPLPTERPSGFYPDPLRVSVRCIPAGKSERRFKTWPEFAQMTAGIIEPKIQITPEIKACAEKLVASRTTRWERVRALTEFMQREITYLAITLDKDSLAGYRPHTAAEVLRDRFGDCKDKATLLTALLRSIGDNGYVVLVYSGNPRVVPADWPSACFNHAIAAIPADADTPAGWPVVDAGELGRLVLFDPTHPFIPLGVLPRGDQSGFGLIAHAKGDLVRLSSEDPKFNGVKRQIYAKIDAQGGLDAVIEESYFGLEGAARHAAREQTDQEKFDLSLRQQLKHAFPLAHTFKSKHTWTPEPATFTLSTSFKLEKYARDIGRGQFLINPRLATAQTHLAPWKLTQEGAVWTTAESCHEEISLSLPEGFTAVELPDGWRTENSLSSCQIHYRTEERAIIVSRESQVKSGFYQKQDYEILRTFFQKSQDAINRPIVIKRTVVAGQ